MEDKIRVIYENWNPNREGVAFVAIQTDSKVPYVWRVYSEIDSLPSIHRAESIIFIPLGAARNLFDFKEGKLADIVKE